MLLDSRPRQNDGGRGNDGYGTVKCCRTLLFRKGLLRYRLCFSRVDAVYFRIEEGTSAR